LVVYVVHSPHAYAPFVGNIVAIERCGDPSLDSEIEEPCGQQTEESQIEGISIEPAQMKYFPLDGMGSIYEGSINRYFIPSSTHHPVQQVGLQRG